MTPAIKGRNWVFLGSNGQVTIEDMRGWGPGYNKFRTVIVLYALAKQTSVTICLVLRIVTDTVDHLQCALVFNLRHSVMLFHK